MNGFELLQNLEEYCDSEDYSLGGYFHKDKLEPYSGGDFREGKNAVDTMKGFAKQGRNFMVEAQKDDYTFKIIYSQTKEEINIEFWHSSQIREPIQATENSEGLLEARFETNKEKIMDSENSTYDKVGELLAEVQNQYEPQDKYSLLPSTI